MNHVSPASQAAVSFASAFAGFCRERTGDAAWLREHRELAFADFVQIGLPTRKHEDWRYTSLRSLAEGAFSLAPQDDVTAEVLAPYVQAGDITLVLVNGRLVTPLEQLGDLPTGLLIAPLADALSVNVPAALRLLKRYATAQQPFSQLNEAFLASGLFIEWNPGVTCERRIHIIHVGSGKDRLVTLPRHMLVLGADAKGEVVETFISIDEGTTSFTNTVTDIELAAGAQLDHQRCQLEAPQALHIGRVRAELAAAAKLTSLSLSAGAKLARIDIDIGLAGQGSEVILNGLYLTREGQHVDHHTVVNHQVPHAKSCQLYKGILGGASRAVFNGVVRVHRDAQLTQAYQMNRNLLLSSDAEIDTKPELQIDADDVKCSHGASVGQLNDDQLFYLTSRGLPPTEARRMLVQAFADDVMLHAPRLHATLRPLTMGYFI